MTSQEYAQLIDRADHMRAELKENNRRCSCGHMMNREFDRDDEGKILNQWHECHSCGRQEQTPSTN